MTPQAKRIEAEALAKAQAEADIVAVMSTPAGRRFVWRLVNAAGILGRSMSETDRETAFNEGRRSFGLTVLDEVQALAKRHYLSMMHEQLNAVALEEEPKREQVSDTDD